MKECVQEGEIHPLLWMRSSFSSCRLLCAAPFPHACLRLRRVFSPSSPFVCVAPANHYLCIIHNLWRSSFSLCVPLFLAAAAPAPSFSVFHFLGECKMNIDYSHYFVLRGMSVCERDADCEREATESRGKEWEKNSIKSKRREKNAYSIWILMSFHCFVCSYRLLLLVIDLFVGFQVIDVRRRRTVFLSPFFASR